METMDLEQIYKKVQTDWASWIDDEHECITLCKKELLAAIQTVNAYLVNYDIKTRIEKDPTPKVCEFCGNTYKGADPFCLNCLLQMKLRLRQLSCLLTEEDMRKVYSAPFVL